MNTNFENPSNRTHIILICDTLSLSSMKPTLKKVSKYENKFAKLQKKAAEFNFRNQLKQVKKKEFTLEEEDKEVRAIVSDRSCASARREFSLPQIIFPLPIEVYLRERSSDLSRQR